MDVQTCPAHSAADHVNMQSCLAPYEADKTPSFEQLGQDRLACRAKGCCWDNDINRGVLINPQIANRLCLWNVPIGSCQNINVKLDNFYVFSYEFFQKFFQIAF